MLLDLQITIARVLIQIGEELDGVQTGNSKNPRLGFKNSEGYKGTEFQGGRRVCCCSFDVLTGPSSLPFVASPVHVAWPTHSRGGLSVTKDLWSVTPGFGRALPTASSLLDALAGTLMCWRVTTA